MQQFPPMVFGDEQVRRSHRGHAGGRAGSVSRCPSARSTEATRDHRRPQAKADDLGSLRGLGIDAALTLTGRLGPGIAARLAS